MLAISMLLQEEEGVDLPKKENLKKTNDSEQTRFFQVVNRKRSWLRTMRRRRH